jgi:hypothetical protein
MMTIVSRDENCEIFNLHDFMFRLFETPTTAILGTLLFETMKFEQ